MSTTAKSKLLTEGVPVCHAILHVLEEAGIDLVFGIAARRCCS
jgi:hypothetical protein